MNFLERSLLAAALTLGLLLGSNFVSNMELSGTAHAFPDDILLPPPPPPPPPEDDCWEEGPNGILINDCLALPPEVSPEPTPSVSPTPEAEDEDEDMDEGEDAGEDLDENDPSFDEDGVLDMDQQGGGCSLSTLGGTTPSNLFYMFGIFMAGLMTWRWKRML